MFLAIYLGLLCACSKNLNTVLTLDMVSIDHLSPRRSITYAWTPPGILTSTRTSTRENALKQLGDKFSCGHDTHEYTDIPVTSIADFPRSRF